MSSDLVATPLGEVKRMTCWKAGLAWRREDVMYRPITPVPPNMRILVVVKGAIVHGSRKNAVVQVKIELVV